jgi:hypothetical protein
MTRTRARSLGKFYKIMLLLPSPNISISHSSLVCSFCLFSYFSYASLYSCILRTKALSAYTVYLTNKQQEQPEIIEVICYGLIVLISVLFSVETGTPCQYVQTSCQICRTYLNLLPLSVSFIIMKSA